MLARIARFWFDATRDICCQSHVIEYPDPNVVVCRRLKILPVEMVVRDYMAGTSSTSIWSMYKQGKREMYGTRFPMACARTKAESDRHHADHQGRPGRP